MSLRPILPGLLTNLIISSALAAPAFLGVWDDQKSVNDSEVAPACSFRIFWSCEGGLITTDFGSDFEIQSSADLGGGDDMLRILDLSDTPAQPVDLDCAFGATR